MLTKPIAMAAVVRLHALKYYPVDISGAADEGMARLFHRMIETPEQLHWLCDTLIDRVGFYPGTEQIRAIFCTRFKPLDGIEANVSPELPIYRSEEQCEAVDKTKAFIESPTLRQIAGTVERDADTDLRGRLKSVGLILEKVGVMPEAKPTEGPITEDDIRHARVVHQLKKLGAPR